MIIIFFLLKQKYPHRLTILLLWEFTLTVADTKVSVIVNDINYSKKIDIENQNDLKGEEKAWNALFAIEKLNNL